MVESSGDFRGADLDTLRKDSATGLRPVTIRQLVEARRPHSEAPWTIDGLEVDQVVIVAHVIRIRRYETVTLLDVEDGTKDGRIIVKRWLNGKESDGFPADEQPFYARILGKLPRGGQESKNVLELKAWQKVADPHHLFLHILEVAFVTLALERGPPPDSVRRSVGPRELNWGPGVGFPTASAPTTPAITRTARPAASQTTQVQQRTPALFATSPGLRTPSPSPSRSIVRSPPTSPSPAPSSPSPAAHLSQNHHASGSRRVSALRRDPYAHLTVLQRAILLQILNAPVTDEEVSMETIVRGISHHDAAPAQIGEALDFLVDEGYICQVRDNEHFTMKTSHYPTSS
ncbi:hypothetical protein BV20DRAFT_961124 [Pilatotrama ljubarskyi]|nr:hypothetical protein BV20DRAFT_961124 [Pilatotrama ljubarskyi]